VAIVGGLGTILTALLAWFLGRLVVSRKRAVKRIL